MKTVRIGDKVEWRGHTYEVVDLLPRAAKLQPLKKVKNFPEALWVRYSALKPVETSNA